MSCSLRRILIDLGSTVLDVAAPAGDLDAEVTGVVIHDAYDEPVTTAGGLLLGVGVRGPVAVTALLGQLGRARAAALVVKGPVEVTDGVRAAARESGVTLLSLTAGAAWAQVAALLRALLDEDAAGPADDADGDLFAVANAIGALLDAPVTIEDRSSRVLAYSARQEEADPPRVETVLGRQVPERYRRLLDEGGYFHRLYAARGPVRVDLGADILPRVAIAVRAGDELLGSVWITARDPLSESAERALRDAAGVVALHLLRRRAGADARRRVRTDLLSTVLAGGADAADAAGRLGIATGPLCVLAAEMADVDGGDPLAVELQRQRLSDALGLHLAAVHPRTAAAGIGRTAYAVLPLPDGADESRAVRVAANLLERTGPLSTAIVGVGRAVTGLPDIARSRADADRVLRVLRSRGATGTVAGRADTHFASQLLHLADLTAADPPPDGPYQRLLAYDAAHDADLARTLAAYLDAFGDTRVAADAVHVHPNTFRYRLRRLAEVARLDLTDPEARLAVALQIRLHRENR
ncbi:helix-turn-helix domain-containing protein [Longispora sp. NPDC051575]|uniref:helix-turn-helix domain-containing protein n=1 Tax=Longispora sp. NPDC051575 TaxID=3154943 RepID=UPI00343C9733